MKNLVVMFLLACSFAFTGCGAASTAVALTQVAGALSDAGSVLSIIERALDSWFAAAPPDPEVRLKANQLVTDAWTALRVANATTRGASHLNEEETAKAFAEFQEAYAELHAFLKEHGVLKAAGLRGPDGTSEIPEPYAMSFGAAE